MLGTIGTAYTVVPRPSDSDLRAGLRRYSKHLGDPLADLERRGLVDRTAEGCTLPPCSRSEAPVAGTTQEFAAFR